jgi:cobalt-zinc-cadmium efflux system protein
MDHLNQNVQVSLPKLFLTIVLNLLITAAQIFGGIISGSLALISDAIHNLSDTVSVVLAWVAQILSRKPATSKSTFGYKRAEILAAFINSIVLIGISVFLVFESVERLLNVRVVDPRWMLWLGLLGLFANGISVIILEREKDKNINIKAAYLHLLGDALTSLAVIAGAVLIWLFKIYWADPLVTILISVYLFVHTLKLLKESVTILMQMAPVDVNVAEIEKRLMVMDFVEEIYHVHLWKLTDKIIHFECHLVLKNDLKISETSDLYKKVCNVLYEEFGIAHVTIQFESESIPTTNCEC